MQLSRGLNEENISGFRILKSRPWAPENPLFTSREKLYKYLQKFLLENHKISDCLEREERIFGAESVY